MPAPYKEFAAYVLSGTRPVRFDVRRAAAPRPPEGEEKVGYPAGRGEVVSPDWFSESGSTEIRGAGAPGPPPR